MADRGDTHYRTGTLHRWFAVSSILFLLSIFWLVLNDASRPWKVYQREFKQIEIQRAEEALATQASQASIAKEKELQGVLADKQSALEGKRAELDAAEAKMRELKGDQFKKTEAEKKSKQTYNYARFVTEEQRMKRGDETYGAEKLDALEDDWTKAEIAKKEVDDLVKQQQAVLDGLNADVTKVQGDIKAATRDIDLSRKKLDQLAPKDAPTRLANFLRDFPGLDFVGPTLKVHKVVLQDLTFELNFTKKHRIDMCQTCHVAIDRGGFEDLQQPFQSHPDLDLYLTAKSPHPLSKVGCTICHRGAGEALDFVRADHRPDTDEETEKWVHDYGWHKQEHWDYPMLQSSTVEAGCVQCHKDSMELIADKAPTMTEGYRLFEQYACYACHKVEWFPTKRRPGPSLKGIRAKTTKDFVASWVTNPTAFRPTTKMPRIFHLENYAPDVVVSRSEYGTGREIMGDEWSNAAVAAVTEFIWGKGTEDSLPAIPVQGDALRGKELFRLTGCLACHNMQPYTDEERAKVLDKAMKARGTNEFGPDLRGVAAKVKPEWLYAWIKDPTSYWPGTKMPNLRLSDQDAADIVAYVFEDPKGVFHDTPEGWNPGPSPYKRDVLEEQARWFFNRELPENLDKKFENEWKDDKALLAALGEKWVLAQGCHSCHEIQGLENAQPIGTELTTWGSKTVDKLAWGMMPDVIAEDRGMEGDEAWHFKEELKAYREPWLMQKLKNPRCFDRDMVKNPIERLRMPQFPFDESQRRALVSFVVGLVDDEVQHAKMVPDPGQAAMDMGLRTIRQKNCAACHVLEPGTIDFDDAGDVHRHVEGEFLPFEGEVIPPSNADIQASIADYQKFTREDTGDDEYKVEDVSLRLLRPEPGVGRTGDSVVVENVKSLRSKPGWGGDFVPLVAEYYLYPTDYDENDQPISLTGDPEGQGRVQDVDGEWRHYDEEPYDKIRWTFAPPILVGEGRKIQRDWLYQFLLEPYPLRQQIRVRMPTFNWAEGEPGSVADYFAQSAARGWPERYTRLLLLDRGTDPSKSKDAADDGLGKLSQTVADSGKGAISPDQIRAIVAGAHPEIAANFPKLRAWADASGFVTYPAVNPEYEAIDLRQPSVLDPLLAKRPTFFDDVHNLAANGPNCFQCHFLKGTPPKADGPIAWAPDLDNVRSRLRPDWVRAWLTNPARTYPGTAMPANFPLDQSSWQDLWPAPSREQIEAVATWLFNLDRWTLSN